MSRESEYHYGGQDENEYMVSHMDYHASNIEDMGDYYDDYTDNDPHDMMDHHRDFRYNYFDYDSVSLDDLVEPYLSLIHI